MEDFQSDNVDLLNFINKKCLDIDTTEPNKIFFLFTKSIRTALLNTYSQQNNIQYTVSCGDLIFNIFWIIYNYSYNAKLTMFMCERAVLLFNEYINISKTYGNEQTNMADVKTFIINKTIGPLKLIERTDLSKINEITQLAQIFRNFIYKIFYKVSCQTDIYYNQNEFFESVCCILSNASYKVYKLGFNNYLEAELEKLSQIDLLDLPREVNILKIKLELFVYCYTSINNYNIAASLSDTILNNNIHIVDDMCDINEFFDCQNRIQDTDFFTKLTTLLNTRLENLTF